MCISFHFGRCMRLLLFQLLPLLQAHCYNKALLIKQQSNRSNAEWHLRFDSEKIDFQHVLSDLNAVLQGQNEQRKIQEEKARSLLITLTVTVAGIIALFQFCGNDASATSLHNNAWVLAGCLIGLLYLLFAAISCVLCLDTDAFAIPQPIIATDKLGGEFQYYRLEAGEHIQFQAEVYANNNLILTRRNNLLVASLRCIHNSLILLFA